MPEQSLIVGISGASGVIYGLEMLRILQQLGVRRHLVMTPAAKVNFQVETEYVPAQVAELADWVHDDESLTAPIASGSYRTAGMVVIPCSIKTLSAIAHSHSANLLARAADVTLKERRPLILVVRETPLHQGHLELMHRVAGLGAVILPPVPAFYHRPRTILDLIHHTIGKVLDCFGIEHGLYRRWGEGASEVQG